MNTKLKAAAELVRETNREVDRSGYATRGSAYYIAVAKLADAYIAEHPDDEDELVTEEYLKSIGFFENDTELEHQSHVVIVDKWGMGFTVCNGKPPIKTRGQVRRLLAALGIHNKENK